MDRYVQMCIEMAQNSAVIFLVNGRKFLCFMLKFASQIEEMLCLLSSNLKSFVVPYLHTQLLCHFESKFLIIYLDNSPHALRKKKKDCIMTTKGE